MARSTRRDDRPGPESEGGRVVVLLVLGLALLVGGGYVVAYLAASNKVPVGTEVAGVDIGGHSPTAAATVLRDGLAGKAGAPFTVVVNGHTIKVAPDKVGLDVDYAASVHAAGAERSWSFSRLWTYYAGGSALDPVKQLDQSRLATLLNRLNAADGAAPTDGSVVFNRHGFVVKQPQTGIEVDPQGAGTEFWNAYLSDDPRVELPLVATAPDIDANAVHRFVNDFANPAMTTAVTLRLGQDSVRLQPSSYGALLGAAKAGHRLQPTVAAPGLARVVADRLGNTHPGTAPRDASVALVSGQPHVVPSQPGTTFAPADLAKALIAAIRAPDRTADVRATKAAASFTSADARALHIRTQISQATIRLPRGPLAPGLAAAAARLDGKVVKPHESLSLRSVLGGEVPGDPASSQLASATFNAAWLGGLQIGSHATLPSYTGAYPVGRDAALSSGQDLSFDAPSSAGVLVSVHLVRPTAAHDGSLSVSLFSTPRWAVDGHTSAPSHVVAPGRVVQHGAGCAEQSGSRGFDVTVTRTLTPVGAGSSHTQSYDVHYAPVARVVCRAARHH